MHQRWYINFQCPMSSRNRFYVHCNHQCTFNASFFVTSYASSLQSPLPSMQCVSPSVIPKHIGDKYVTLLPWNHVWFCVHCNHQDPMPFVFWNHRKWYTLHTGEGTRLIYQCPKSKGHCKGHITNTSASLSPMFYKHRWYVFCIANASKMQNLRWLQCT